LLARFRVSDIGVYVVKKYVRIQDAVDDIGKA